MSMCNTWLLVNKYIKDTEINKKINQDLKAYIQKHILTRGRQTLSELLIIETPASDM